jgi:predicted metal-dependent peptidase
MAQGRKDPPKENLKAIQEGMGLLRGHPLFAELKPDPYWRPVTDGEPFSPRGYARLHSHPHRYARAEVFQTTIEVNPWRRAPPEEWAHVLGQSLLHFYLCHADPERTDEAWRVACEIVAGDFIQALDVGRRPEHLTPADRPVLGRDIQTVAAALRDGGPALTAVYAGFGLAAGAPSFTFSGSLPPLSARVRREREEALAAAIRASMTRAIAQAGEIARGPATAKQDPNSMAQRARAWFVSSYPLLGALAAAFDIVEDAALCELHDIAIAAVDSELRRVYINPRFAWTYPGMQFVVAHELLHVGLRHEERRQGRDAYLWNVACDYVINGWLVEMGVGEMPTDDLLLDPELGFEKESAEAIYDRIVGDLRLARRLNKVRTMRGVGKVDVLGERPPAWWNGPGADLDAFYRRALAEGLDLHAASGQRGLLPGDLVEEIRAIQQRPIPWDVRLGQWMDAFFPPLEARRSFARASRRQASTPDIPRAVWIRPEERLTARTFGVVLDTSGSMPPRLLARALGAIASYALGREVPLVRVLQCDAGVHDMGYVEPESLLGRVEVRGRGGTVLQPAISKLESDDRFPRDAPILIITDGGCDQLSVRRQHAYLMPEGARLPFRTSAPRFAFESG